MDLQGCYTCVIDIQDAVEHSVGRCSKQSREMPAAPGLTTALTSLTIFPVAFRDPPRGPANNKPLTRKSQSVVLVRMNTPTGALAQVHR